MSHDPREDAMRELARELERESVECCVVLTPDEWAELQGLLARPPRVIPELANLLRELRAKRAAEPKGPGS